MLERDKSDLRKKLENIGSFIIMATMLGVILYHVITENAEAASEYTLELPAREIKVEVDFDLMVNGQRISLDQFSCPDVIQTCPEIDPTEFREGYSCKLQAGSVARGKRERVLEKYTGSKLPASNVERKK